MSRRCCKCNRIFDEGFSIADGEAYYCSEECMYDDYSDQEYEDMLYKEYLDSLTENEKPI